MLEIHILVDVVTDVEYLRFLDNGIDEDNIDYFEN